MVKINVLQVIHFGDLNFPHLKVYCSFSCRASVTSLGTPQMLADLQASPFPPLAQCRALEGCGMAPGLPTASCCFSCLQQPAAKHKAAVLLQTSATGNGGGLETGVCCPTPNIQITGLLICDSPLYPSGNLYYCFVSLDFLLVLSNLIAITAVVGRKREVQIYSIVNMKRIWTILSVSE